VVKEIRVGMWVVCIEKRNGYWPAYLHIESPTASDRCRRTSSVTALGSVLMG
jgi:hypothetical protein